MRSMVRTVGQFGIPGDAAASNHEGEAHLDELMRRRAAEIASGAEADTPDVISQILLATRTAACSRASGSAWATSSSPRPRTRRPRC